MAPPTRLHVPKGSGDGPENLSRAVSLPDVQAGDEGTVGRFELPTTGLLEITILHVETRALDGIERCCCVETRRHFLPDPKGQIRRLLAVEEGSIDLDRPLALAPPPIPVIVVPDEVGGPDHFVVDEGLRKALAGRLLAVEAIADPEVQRVALGIRIDCDGLRVRSVAAGVRGPSKRVQGKTTIPIHCLVLRADGSCPEMRGPVRNDSLDLPLFPVLTTRGQPVLHVAGLRRIEGAVSPGVEQQP